MVDAAAATPDRPEIPDKLYFRIGEVARLAGVKPYVLRYWEREFPMLEPKKSGTNHRLYRRKDVETILEIKRLLYDNRFTIEGARKHFQRGKVNPPPKKAGRQKQTALFDSAAAAWPEIRRELEEILVILRKPLN